MGFSYKLYIYCNIRIYMHVCIYILTFICMYIYICVYSLYIYIHCHLSNYNVHCCQVKKLCKGRFARRPNAELEIGSIYRKFLPIPNNVQRNLKLLYCCKWKFRFNKLLNFSVCINTKGLTTCSCRPFRVVSNGQNNTYGKSLSQRVASERHSIR